ncbi:MAG: hypothetical protein PHS48_06330 [Bacteroidales bacterium]|nr:hypothetical protein [Bacteroidales bacterium]
MKHFWIFFPVLFLLTACHTAEKLSLVYKQLVALDSLLAWQPQAVLDSLNNMDIHDFPEAEEAYYNLLLTIAMDKSYYEFRDDRVISQAVAWYQQGKDPANYARSLLYKGIVLYSLNPIDTLAFIHFKEAEHVMKANKMENPSFFVLLYGYLGDINQRNKNYEVADEYYQKGLEASRKAGNYDNYVLSLVSLFYSKITLGEKEEAQKILKEINELDNVPVNQWLSPNNIYVVFSQTGNTFRDVINGTLNDSLKWIAPKDYPGVLSIISRFYRKVNCIDSAIVYGKACLNAIVDTLNIDNQQYYANLANLYSIKGDYRNAAGCYCSALQAFSNYHAYMNDKRVLELEKKYNVAEVNQKLLEEKLTKRVYLLLCVLLLALVIISFILVYHWKRLTKENKLLLEERQRNIRQLKFFVSAFNSTMGILPEFIAEINHISHKSRVLFPELYDNLQDRIDNVNSQYNRAFSEITKSLEFNEIFSIGEVSPRLSDREKIIYVLSKSGFSNELIAGIINASVNNIRSSKCKIRTKLHGGSLV